MATNLLLISLFYYKSCSGLLLVNDLHVVVVVLHKYKKKNLVKIVEKLHTYTVIVALMKKRQKRVQEKFKECTGGIAETTGEHGAGNQCLNRMTDQWTISWEG